MAEDKFITLVKMLRQRTAERNVDWQRTAEPEVFQAVFPGTTVLLGMDNDIEDPAFRIRLLDQDGEIIEDLQDFEIQQFFVRGAGEEVLSVHELLRETYRSARRTALGVETAVSSLLELLASGPGERSAGAAPKTQQESVEWRRSKAGGPSTLSELRHAVAASPARVNIHEPHEVAYWTQKWGITETQLREAHDKVGVMVDQIELHLRKHGLLKNR